MSAFLGYAHLAGFQHGRIREALKCLERGNIAGAQLALHHADDRYDEQLAINDAEIAAQVAANPWLAPMPVVSPPVAPGEIA